MKWIKCEERLPEVDKVVICCCTETSFEDVWVGWLHDLNGYSRKRARKPEKYPVSLLWMKEGGHTGVTHWMPLPEPPKN